MSVYIETFSKFGQRIRVIKRYWDYITGKHESIIGLEEEVLFAVILTEKVL